MSRRPVGGWTPLELQVLVLLRQSHPLRRIDLVRTTGASSNGLDALLLRLQALRLVWLARPRRWTITPAGRALLTRRAKRTTGRYSELADV